MRIYRALHLGMCFGVRDAIELALRRAAQAPLTILGDLVHNATVLAELRARGIRVAQRPSDVATRETMITAHGASARRIAEARAQGLNVLEATCPLVKVAHRVVARLVADGYHPVIIGQRDHVEVRGLTEDLLEYDVVLDEADVRRLAPRTRFGVASQTTQPIARVRALVDFVQACFPASEVKFVDTVCQPTKLRQSSAGELAQRVDVMVVIGGSASNNTRELLALCQQRCARAHHVQTAAELRPEWFVDCAAVGLTAGTSTPDTVIAGVEAWLGRLASGRAARVESSADRVIAAAPSQKAA